MNKWKFGNYNKYNNTAVKVDGYRFDSRAEARYYEDLKLLKASDVVLGFDIHPVFRLKSDIKYEADFTIYFSDGRIEVVDVKGLETPEFKIKKRLFNELHPLAPLIVVKKV